MVEVNKLQKWQDDGASLIVEFNQETYDNIVRLAKAEGGVLLLGVEHDGRFTHASSRHATSPDPKKLQAAIFHNTQPRIKTKVSVIPLSDVHIIAIEVPSYPKIRAPKSSASPPEATETNALEPSPLYVHEQTSRRANLSQLDKSAQLCIGISDQDLDPLEFERIRQTIPRLHGDTTLLELSDTELAQALQLLETTDQGLVPNVAGLLLLGKEHIIQSYIPTHEVAFQVLNAQGDVQVNDFFRKPLLATIEAIQHRFDARVEEEELMIGMFRLPLPAYSRIAFREAVLNALLHRDYSQQNTVFIQWHHDHLLLTSPGGLLEGITLHNLLIHEPKPRNPRLYNAAKRIGLVEKTGRGVDRIFYDQLRCGHPAPSYARTDADAVRVVMHGGKANRAFARLVYELTESVQQLGQLSVDELLILRQLSIEPAIGIDAAATLIQKPVDETQLILGHMQERHLLETHDTQSGKVHVLDASIQHASSTTSVKTTPDARVKDVQANFEKCKEAIVFHINTHGKITRSQTKELCDINLSQATRILQKLCKNGLLQMEGRPPKGAFYVHKQ